MSKPKVHRGQELHIGPLRVVVTGVVEDYASVQIVFNNETTLGTGAACPVECIEKLVDWHSKLPVGMIASV